MKVQKPYPQSIIREKAFEPLQPSPALPFLPLFQRFFLFDRHLYPVLYPLPSSISGATCRQLRMFVYFLTGQ